MPEKPDGKSISDKALSNKGQEPTNVLKHDGSESPAEAAEKGAEPASKKLAETAWAPGSEAQIANVQVLPPGFPQPELVSGSLILEGQVMPAGSLHPSWDLTDQQVNERAKQVREALDRRSFLGLGGPDPDLQQVTKLLEELKLSDRRAIEMVLSREHDFRQDLQSKLADKPNDYNNLIKMLDRPDRSESQAMDNPQAIFYARKIIESLKDFSKDGVDTAVNLLLPLSQAEKQQIEKELSSELQMPFRDWLKRTMPVGHHTIGLNNEGIARIEAVLDQPDSATDYKGSFKVLMASLKDNWSADKENAVLHIVSGMDGKEIRDSGLFKELSNSPCLSKSAHDALDVLLTGRDKWTQNPTQAQSLAETALAAKNLEMFKDAMQSEHARKFFRSEKGSQEIDSAFSGPFDARQKQIAHDYADLNDTKLLTDLQMYQFSLSPSKEAITQRLMSASDDEKKLFQQGRDLADLRPKETQEEKAASKYYLEVYEALRSASKYDSQQLKEWTGILLAKETEHQTPVDPKQQALKQIIDDNRLGLTGLDAVRHLETALRLNPEFAKTLENNSQPDKELKQAFESALKRIADSSTASSVGSTAWKELTDINNYNPLTALAATPDRMQRQQELSQRLAAGSSEQLQKQLLSKGQLSLEQKLHIAGDTKLTAEDLLTLETSEKERLLKGQYPHQVQEKVFGAKDQSEFVRSVLSKQDARLTELDQVRAFTLGLGNGNQSIESLLGGMKANQRKQLSDQYFDKYRSVMNADILSQVKDPVDKAKMQQYLRHSSITFEQKLVDAQFEQTKHASAFDGLSEAYSPDQRMANKYARAAESFYHQVKDGLTDKQQESLEKLPPEKKQEIAVALMKYQSALKHYWSAQKDYTRNKEEMAEQLADATLTAGAVIASIAQPELTPALVARSAALSAAGRLGIKQAVMDKDFDTSNASFQKELYKGTMTGVLNSLGGEAFTSGRFIKLGKFGQVTSSAAERSISELGANQALKSVLKEDAEQLLNRQLEQTTMDKVFGSQKKCLADAKEAAKTIAPTANSEQLAQIAKTIQQHRRQEVLNSFKGKFWHEGDQLATSVTASVAGAVFAETASTAAGYEKPETLLQRLELAGKSAVVGGALFHIGFKAVGKGVQGVSAIIGKDTQGHLYAAPGTQVRTAAGKEMTVGKEPYYFQKDDTVVEFRRDTRREVSAPPFLEAAAMPPESIVTSETTEKPKTRVSVVEQTKDTIQKDVRNSFDKISELERQNFMQMSDADLTIFQDHYKLASSVMRDPIEKESVQQRFAFINWIKLTRQREELEALALKTELSLSTDQFRMPNLVQNELGLPRATTGHSPERLHDIAKAYGIPEKDIKHAFGLTTSELVAESDYFETALAKASTPEMKMSFQQLKTLNNLILLERIDHYKSRHPGLSTERIKQLSKKNSELLSFYRSQMLEPLIERTQKDKVKAYCKRELALVGELEAEHLQQALDSSREKRISPSAVPVREEIRIQHQLSISESRQAINALLGKTVPESMRASRAQMIEADLARFEGVPKATGKPVQVTDSLAAIPWKHGEMLYSRDGQITINDKQSRTSRTLNSSGQLIETVSPHGEIRQYTYADNETNDVKAISFRNGSAIITIEKGKDSYHKTTTFQDGKKEIEPLGWTKLETKSNGSYDIHEMSVLTTKYPDGSYETRIPGKRTSYQASLRTEEAHLRTNIHEAFREMAQTNKDLADKRERRFSGLLKDFESMATNTKMSDQEKANFYLHVNRILDGDKTHAIKTNAGRREIAEQVLYHATHARDIDQGQNKTCNVTTVEKRCWAKYPAALAQFAADVAETGKFITTSGQVIDMTEISHGKMPDNESWRSLRLQRQGKSNEIVVDGQRGWLSQITQIAMVNAGWRKMSLVVTPKGIAHPKEIAFDHTAKLLGKINPDDVTKLYDDQDRLLTRWDGKEAVYDKDHNLLPVTYDDLVYDSTHHLVGKLDRTQVAPLVYASGKVANAKLAPGDVLYDKPGGTEIVRSTNYGEIEYGKIEHPIMTVPDRSKLKNLERLIIKSTTAREYCKSADGEYISQPKMGIEEFPRIVSEITGRVEKEPFVVLRAKKKGEFDTRNEISTKEELAEQIKKWQNDGNLPGIIYVHAGKPPFNQHYDPKDVAAIKHGWHVVNVWGLDGNMVDMTNQWGKKDNLKITLDELFESMIDPAGKTGV